MQDGVSCVPESQVANITDAGETVHKVFEVSVLNGFDYLCTSSNLFLPVLIQNCRINYFNRWFIFLFCLFNLRCWGNFCWSFNLWLILICGRRLHPEVCYSLRLKRMLLLWYSFWKADHCRFLSCCISSLPPDYIRRSSAETFCDFLWQRRLSFEKWWCCRSRTFRVIGRWYLLWLLLNKRDLWRL